MGRKNGAKNNKENCKKRKGNLKKKVHHQVVYLDFCAWLFLDFFITSKLESQQLLCNWTSLNTDLIFCELFSRRDFALDVYKKCFEMLRVICAEWTTKFHWVVDNS